MGLVVAKMIRCVVPTRFVPVILTRKMPSMLPLNGLTLPQNTFDGLGSHTAVVVVAVAQLTQ